MKLAEKRGAWYGETEKERIIVQRIIEDVYQNGDAAVLKYSRQFDCPTLQNLCVTEEEIQAALPKVTEKQWSIFRRAIANIKEYHQKQKRESWFYTREDGTFLGQKVTPLERVAVYVPGGTAAYPSSVIMNTIPALIAGVKEIILVSPAMRDGKMNDHVLAIAHELGIKEIYKAGGAQAIAACAFGTETIAPVDKIVGPGNIYVALAKRELFGVVHIDMIAGPSELCVIADDTANPSYVAADLLSQAEHDERARCILITTSKEKAQAVSEEVTKQLQTLPRQSIAERAWQDHSQIIVVETIEEACARANELAPEHLELIVKEPFQALHHIQNAGSIFLGEYSSEPVGDYFGGPNHVLPTSGTARFFSGLGVDDFIKKSSIIQYSKQAFQRDREAIAAFARLEGLEAHARAIDIRKEER